jgi:hypothetical protein
MTAAPTAGTASAAGALALAGFFVVVVVVLAVSTAAVGTIIVFPTKHELYLLYRMSISHDISYDYPVGQETEVDRRGRLRLR